MKKYMLFILISLGLTYSYLSTELVPDTKVALPIKKIDAAELKALMDTTPDWGDPEKCNIVVVNTLGKQYFEDCRIPGSIVAPLYVHYADEGQRRLFQYIVEWQSKGWIATKEFIVYCALARCDASAQAALMLQGVGAKVRAYEGGIREWFQLGYPVEGPCSYEYLRSISCDGDCRKAIEFECGVDVQTANHR